MSAPVFIDTVHAAEMLRIPPETVLDWIRDGKLQTYGGRTTNPFVRAPDVLALAGELGVTAQEEAPKRVKSGTARVQTRLTADAKWADISDADIEDWVSRSDAVRRQAAKRAAEVAQERLAALLGRLNGPDL